MALGTALGAILRGGEVIELIGDLGVGKTEFVRGLAQGANSTDVVQSPSFTISRVYKCADFDIFHYDFYRLGDDVGIMKSEISEQIADQSAVIVTEWASEVHGFLPNDRLQIKINYLEDESSRNISLTALGHKSAKILEQINDTNPKDR